MIGHINEVSSAPADGRRKMKRSWFGPTGYGLPTPAAKHSKRVADRMKQGVDRRKVSRAAVTGRHMDVDRIDLVQSPGADPSQQA